MSASRSILVVDDEQSNIDLIMGVLKPAGFVVASANDGFKAIAACKVRMPDLILLDLQMPLMSGIDVFKRLHMDEKTRQIPVIFLRRKGEKASELALEDDEYWVLSKPVAKEELLNRVHMALRQRSLKDELMKKDLQLRALSLTDPLTTFRSMRYLAEFLRAEINQCRRYLVPLSLVLLQIDNYAEILENEGQSVCNGLISQIAALINSQNREADIMVRFSESELGLFLTHTPLSGAVEVSERLRESVAENGFTVEEKLLPITVSLGISQLTENMDEDGKTLISYARSAVEQALAAGGNMTLVAE